VAGRLLVIGAGLVFANSAFAATYYADEGGDTNAGTSIGAAFQTIQRAASVMTAGDTCYIRKGVYREKVTPTNSGTLSAPITFDPYNGKAVIVSGADLLSVAWSVHSGSIYRASTVTNFRQLTQGTRDSTDRIMLGKLETLIARE
jgi:hypothetical protein